MLKNVAPSPKPGTIRKARKLRREMSLPEVLLWRELRKRPEGLKFRRQHASGGFVLDFYCSDARLAIEMDGAAHDCGDRPHRDESRDAWLANAGIATLRIPARDVLNDLEAVVRQIISDALARLPLHHPLRGRSPSTSELGED